MGNPSTLVKSGFKNQMILQEVSFRQKYVLLDQNQQLEKQPFYWT